MVNSEDWQRVPGLGIVGAVSMMVVALLEECVVSGLSGTYPHNHPRRTIMLYFKVKTTTTQRCREKGKSTRDCVQKIGTP